MHTKMLMFVSAAVMMVAGLLLTFAPQELLERLTGSAQPGIVLLVQAMGGLYCGFAMMNWMARVSLIGGIYGRPIAMGNFLHFGIAGLAFGKAAIGAGWAPVVLAPAAICLGFAAWFGWVLFGDPLSRPKPSKS